MQDKDKKAIINAIGDLGRRVTSADVATKTGLPVLVVQQKLNQVAAETGGHLQVGTAGDIVYSFAPGFSNKYLAKGLTAAFLLVGTGILQGLFYVVRISFGVALILSLMIVILLIIAITVAMLLRTSSDRNDGFDFGGGDFHFSFWDWMIIRDLFMWDAMTRRQPIYYNYNQPTIRRRQRSSFLLNCFSFLFGDGDPNEGITEKRWQVVAQVIKKNHNVVTAEQLAPYIGADPKDEDAVLPVLVRFNGRPEVTASGNIVYVFESMQSIAADQDISPPSYLREFPWKFTNVPEGELVPVFVVAGLNLGGAVLLHNWIARVAAASALNGLINGLLIYGSLFLAIPLIRVLINGMRNKKIQERNKKRANYASMLKAPSEELAAKLSEAKAYSSADRRIEAKDVVYTTEKDSLDQGDALSEKFEEMEKPSPKKKAPRSKKKPRPADSSQNDVQEVPGHKLNVKDYQTEFDASP